MQKSTTMLMFFYSIAYLWPQFKIDTTAYKVWFILQMWQLLLSQRTADIVKNAVNDTLLMPQSKLNTQ